jgi:hypothetical protein
MTKSISWCILISVAAVLTMCAVAKPDLLSDKKGFLHHFVNHELLAVLGIIMTITLASAASLHLEFNKIEEQHNKRGLVETRRGVKQGAYFLIILFVVSVVLVVVKPLAQGHEMMEAILNGAAIYILLWNVLVLLELTQLAFSIQPNFEK